MWSFRRWLIRSGLGLLGTVLVLAGTIGWLGWVSLPQVQGEISLPSLEAPVTIVRDAYAIPHVEASSVTDATTRRSPGAIRATVRVSG